MLLDYLKTLPQHFVPHHYLSRFSGLVANFKYPLIKNYIINDFISRYGVDMNTALEPDPSKYQDFNSFFTRLLKPEARPLIQERSAIACPVDGTISQIGNIENGRLFQAKGFTFDLCHLLGGNTEQTQLFNNGQFATFYLSPKDYHRVHMPITGQLRQMTHIPGRLFSVNPRTSRAISSLYARNERVVTLFDTEFGPMAIVLVGAMLVASICLAWTDQIKPLRSKHARSWQYSDSNLEPIILERGQEVGHFKLGSTVILLFGPQMMQFASHMQKDVEVKLGEKLGEFFTLS